MATTSVTNRKTERPAKKLNHGFCLEKLQVARVPNKDPPSRRKAQLTVIRAGMMELREGRGGGSGSNQLAGSWLIVGTHSLK